MPMLAETKISPPVPTGIGRSQASAMRSATANDSASESTSQRTTNSSPPSRATVSEPRIDVLQARAERDEEVVARLVAERVVDRLELVDVEQQDGDERVRALRAGEGVLDAVVEQRPVRQAGEAVVERLVAHARLALVAVERGGEQVGHRLQPLGVVGGEDAERRRRGRR